MGRNFARPYTMDEDGWVIEFAPSMGHNGDALPLQDPILYDTKPRWSVGLEAIEVLAPRTVSMPVKIESPYYRTRDAKGNMIVVPRTPVNTPTGRVICAQCVYPKDIFPCTYLCPSCAEQVEASLSKSG